MFLNIVRHISIVHPAFRNLQPLPSHGPGAVLSAIIIGAFLVIIFRCPCKPARTHDAGGIKAVKFSVNLMPFIHDNFSIVLRIVPVIIIRIPGIQAADDKPFFFLHGAVISHITLIAIIIRYPAFPVIQSVCVKIIGPFPCLLIPDCLIPTLKHGPGFPGVIPALRHCFRSTVNIFNLEPAVILEDSNFIQVIPLPLGTVRIPAFPVIQAIRVKIIPVSINTSPSSPP